MPPHFFAVIRLEGGRIDEVAHVVHQHSGVRIVLRARCQTREVLIDEHGLRIRRKYGKQQRSDNGVNLFHKNLIV